jgi:hypothetical protein
LRIDELFAAFCPSPPPEVFVVLHFGGESEEEFNARYPDLPKADKVINLKFDSGSGL